MARRADGRGRACSPAALRWLPTTRRRRPPPLRPPRRGGAVRRWSAAPRTPATPARRPRSPTRSGATRRRSRTSRRSSTPSTTPTPKITVKVTVSDWEPYWDKLQTIARRRRRTRRLRDGRAALPRLPEPRRPARPQAVHRPRRVRPDPAGRPGRGRLHDARRPVRPAARPQRRSPSTTTRRCSTRPVDPVSGRDLGLGEAGRGRQAADRWTRTATARSTQWGFYTETTDMENYWSLARLAERRRHRLGRPQDEPRRQRPRRPAASSSSRT